MIAKIESLLNRSEESYWKKREFAARLDLLPHTHADRERLTESLQHFNTHPSVVPGLHQVRFLWPAVVELYGHEPVSNPYSPLLFYCTYEGDLEDVLHALFEYCPLALDAVLEHCWNYPGLPDTEGCVRQLLESRVEPTAALRANQGVESPRSPMPAADALPLMSPFERAIPDEQLWIERATMLFESYMQRTTRESRRRDPQAVSRRGAHVKHHGLLDSKFVVRPDIPHDLRWGIFQPDAEYRALLRLSNMSQDMKADDEMDARGLAIKLYDVAGQGKPMDVGAPLPSPITQDFHLASDPAFFLENIREYAVVRSILNLRKPRDRAVQLGLYLLRRPREAWIFGRSIACRPDHPLTISYHSMTASALGYANVVKYLVRPLPPRPAVVSGAPPRSSDHLRAALRRSLDPARGRALRLEFCLVLPRELTTEWTEDPRLGIRRHKEIVPVATIEIERQDPCTPERLERAEAEIFSPWHTLREHRPVGSLGRARLSAYRASSRLRTQANQSDAPPVSPSVDLAAEAQ